MAAAQAPGHPILDFTFDTLSDLSTGGNGPNSTYQYHAVKAGAADLTVAASTSANTRVMGVLQTATSSGGNTVRLLGLTKHVVDGTTPILPGDWLTTDSVGRGTKTTSANVEVYAMALQNSTAANDVITVFLAPGLRY